jgi:hypothetical protein
LTDIALAALGVRGPEAIGHKSLDALPNELAGRVGEELLRLRVDEDNFSISIRDDHCIGHGVEERLKLNCRLRKLHNNAGLAPNQTAVESKAARRGAASIT